MAHSPEKAIVEYAPGRPSLLRRPAPRWLVRAIQAILITLLFAVVIHTIWSVIGVVRMRRMIAGCRAAGEPVLAEELQPTIPDGENSALAWRAAASRVVPSAAFDELSWLVDENIAPPLRPNELATIRSVLSENATMLAGIARSTASTKANWNVRLQTPHTHILLPDLNPQRELSWVLTAAALEAHHRGDTTQTLKWIELLLRQADALEQQPADVAHMVALGIAFEASLTAEQIAPDLDISLAQRSSVKQLIERFLDEQSMRDGFKLGLRSKRLVIIDYATHMMEQEPPSPSRIEMWQRRMMSYGIGPASRSDGVTISRYLTDTMNVAQSAPDWPTYRSVAPSPPGWSNSDRSSMLHPLGFFSPDQRYIRSQYILMGERRLAATALALRLFACDHNGRLPATLSELVPGYLPSIPLDTMAINQPLRYDPGRSGGAILYSVGENGRDDDGSEESTRVNPGRWDTDDVVVYLTIQPRKPPVPRPTTGAIPPLPMSPAPQ